MFLPRSQKLMTPHLFFPGRCSVVKSRNAVMPHHFEEKKGFFAEMTKRVCLVIVPENWGWVNGLP